ncbi:MAG: peptidase [Rhodospirillaceae bacterium]|nr:peptidase [Rhodospirillaceae bacterium]MDE0619498.1 peptidase [Rhodospirillaceae bacterium]
MTYCVGIKVNEGLVLASDSRTNAGVDRVSTFRKMFAFDRPGDRLFVLLTSGNLSVTQSVVSILSRQFGAADAGQDLMAADSMFAAARIVGGVMRDVQDRDGPAIRAAGVDSDATIIFGGQVRGGRTRLYQIYTAGNFVEATAETLYFQAGEVKYGKPVLDRVIRPETSLIDAAKCALVSFDSTMRSNMSVGPPIDVLLYRTDTFEIGHRASLEADDPYFSALSAKWSESLNRAFLSVEDPDWPI